LGDGGTSLLLVDSIYEFLSVITDGARGLGVEVDRGRRHR